MAYEFDIVTPAQTGVNTPFVVASSGEYPGYEAWRAFDHDNTLSSWKSFSTLPVWISIYIPSNAHVLTSYAITGGGSNWSPKDFTLQGSNNNVTWTVIDTQVGRGALPRYEIPIIGSTIAYTYYKLNVTALTGSGFQLVLAELELIDNGTHVIDITTPAQTSASVPFTVTIAPGGEVSALNAAWKAFDHSAVPWANDYWWCGVIGGGQSWIQIAIPGNINIVEGYAITANPILSQNNAPKAWTLQGSNDGIAWTVLDTRTNEITWGQSERRAYSAVASLAYAYYKLDFTASGGTNTDLKVQEIELNVGYHASVAATLSKLQPYYIGNANTFLSFPALAVDSFVAGVPIVAIKGNLPAMSGVLNHGATISGNLITLATVTFHAGTNVHSAIASTVPMLSGNVTTGSIISARIPVLFGSSICSQTVPSSIIGSFAALTGDIKTGAAINVNLTSNYVGVLQATTGTVASIHSATLPTLTGSVNGLTQQFAQISGTITAMTGDVLIRPDISASLSDLFPSVTGSIYAYTGKTSKVSMVFPAMFGYLSGYQTRNAQIAGSVPVVKRSL